MGRSRNRIDPGAGRGQPGRLRLETWNSRLPKDFTAREVSLSTVRDWAATGGLGTKALYRDLADLRKVGYIHMVKKPFPGSGGTMRRRTVVSFLPVDAVREIGLPRYDKFSKLRKLQHDRFSRRDVSRAIEDVAAYLRDVVVLLSSPKLTLQEGDALYLAAMGFARYWVGEIFNCHRNYAAPRREP